MMFSHSRILLPVMALSISLIGCQHIDYSSQTRKVDAKATLNPASDSKVHGQVWIEDHAQGSLLTINLENLPAGGVHGFHIHEHGDCSAADASSAGGHYNPRQQAHGWPNRADSHAGDIQNISADAQGKIQQGLQIPLKSAELIGRSLVVHAGKDDYQTQPAGNSGKRIACGVIVTAR